MGITIEAIYENGVLKPTQLLPFREKEKLLVTIEPSLTVAERTAGMMGCPESTQGSAYFAMFPDLAFVEPEEDL